MTSFLAYNFESIVQFFVKDKFISNHTWWWRRGYGCNLCSGSWWSFCLQLWGRGCNLCRFWLGKWNTFVRSVAFALFFFVCWLAFFEIYFANDILFLFRMSRFGWIAETKNTHLALNNWIKMRCCKTWHSDIEPMIKANVVHEGVNWPDFIFLVRNNALNQS